MFFIIFVFLVFFTIMDLKYLPSPYIWGALSWGVCCLAYALRATRSTARIVFANLSIFLFCIGLLEAGAAILSSKPDRWVYSQDYYNLDDVLGYAPHKNIKVSCQRYRGSRLLYNAAYTINKDGLRISPPVGQAGCRDAILFFGCSFTYGEGLNDNETMPYIVGERSKTQVYNFGFHGYGPHQMLSAIEHGLVDEVIDCQPRYAIYQTGFFHVERAAGYYQWDPHGPKYVLTRDGRVKYAGHFDDKPMKRLMDGLLRQSAIYNTFIASRSWVTKKDIERFIAIVVTAKNELVEKYPGLEFHVIYWGPAGKDDRMIIARLEKAGIKIHLLRNILVPKTNDWHKEFLAPDGHPSFNANKTFADYIIRNILHKPAAGGT
jgi:hypothetical protein